MDQPDAEMIPRCLQDEISNLLGALTLKALHSIETDGVAVKLDRLTAIAMSAHGALARIDQETNEIGAQLEEIASASSAELASRLRGLAAKLAPIGKTTPLP